MEAYLPQPPIISSHPAGSIQSALLALLSRSVHYQFNDKSFFQIFQMVEFNRSILHDAFTLQFTLMKPYSKTSAIVYF